MPGWVTIVRRDTGLIRLSTVHSPVSLLSPLTVRREEAAAGAGGDLIWCKEEGCHGPLSWLNHWAAHQSMLIPADTW